MNQPYSSTPDAPSRSFATDVPRSDLAVGRPAISNKLWAGMATAAVVAAVGVGALAAPATLAPTATTAAAPVAGALSQAQGTVADAVGAGSAESVQAPAEAPAADPPAAEVPAEAAPPPPAVEPAPAPEPATEPATAAGGNQYTVVPGDTVGAIAARFGVDMNAMLAANGLGQYSIILPGQTLVLTGPAVAVPAAAPAPAPASAPAPAAAPAPAPVVAAPAVRTIYIAGAGGQSMVDACIGPIHYTPNDGYSLFITEHDFCGGWARFSGIGVGETVSIPGYGTYTVTGRGQVPNPGTTNDVINVFGGFPRAILQTCIPGTSQMLLIALN
ncbi:LysM repeat protein [Arthrobacter sp. SLBN-100]|uniref:LysM peptidoglycan-binding domain-containing protein n=1 Tax=Arthrobacter sp. SLBN-100 TaxID=2768450 RepID=UPI00114FC94B|nr:LysM domain-containing protein [Arthrobacter sp. SLBN-100]TQJ67551.1 LysM repeat protein [Arthrobacter sp. SLBN-100]